MNNKVEEATKDSVLEMTREDNMFTAFDVTKIVRKTLGRSEKVFHNDVNGIVQGMFNGGQIFQKDNTPYTRSLIDIGSTAQPWLYHPVSFDPTSYDKNWTSNMDQTKSKKAQDTSVTLDFDEEEEEDEEDENDDSFDDPFMYGCTTKEGRLNIPQSLLSKIPSNQKAYFLSDKIIISKDDPGIDSYFSSISLNKKRVRISKRNLRKSFGNSICSNSSFNFAYKDNHQRIVITKA